MRRLVHGLDGQGKGNELTLGDEGIETSLDQGSLQAFGAKMTGGAPEVAEPA